MVLELIPNKMGGNDKVGFLTATPNTGHQTYTVCFDTLTIIMPRQMKNWVWTQCSQCHSLT